MASLEMLCSLPGSCSDEGTVGEGIIEWAGLERTLEINSTQPPATGRNTPLWTRLLSAPASLALSASQGGGIHSLSGQPVPKEDIQQKSSRGARMKS